MGGRPPTVLRLVRASPAVPANRQGPIRVFADEGEPMRTLLAHLLAARRVEPAIAGDAPVGYSVGSSAGSTRMSHPPSAWSRSAVTPSLPTTKMST